MFWFRAMKIKPILAKYIENLTLNFGVNIEKLSLNFREYCLNLQLLIYIFEFV